MDRQIQGLVLGCALMLMAPSGAVMTHQLQFVARIAASLSWSDMRVSIVCSESNPLARVCARLHAE